MIVMGVYYLHTKQQLVFHFEYNKKIRKFKRKITNKRFSCCTNQKVANFKVSFIHFVVFCFYPLKKKNNNNKMEMT